MADLAEQFALHRQQSKLVGALGKFPLPVEVIPMAAAQVIHAFAKLGGTGKVREGVTTDNGNLASWYVTGLQITAPARFESDIDQIPGRRDHGRVRAQQGRRVPAAVPRTGVRP